MKYLAIAGSTIAIIWITSGVFTAYLRATYDSFSTHTVVDRYNTPITVAPNSAEQYCIAIADYPEPLKQLVIQKEDRFFSYHPGINPFSIMRALFSGIKTGDYGGSSTITQQLAKILLGNTTERTLTHKLQEVIATFSLELHLSKAEIMNMYLNSIYLGNQAQGFAQASWVYYNRPIDELTTRDLVSLVATLSSPSVSNPWKTENNTATAQLADRLHITATERTATTTHYDFNTHSAFEISRLLSTTTAGTKVTTIDSTLTEQIRMLAQQHTLLTAPKGGTEVAVVVIEIPSNHVLAIVGSPDPTSLNAGAQINMALEPRPIGSTIKPFIYGSAFTHGVRPYSLVVDREYKYQIGTGFPLYPKNFDGTYQGEIDLRTALANSLNTPSIKLLEYVSLPTFYDLLEETMQFTPINPLSSYAYGIALGGLEMDLLTLTHYFTTFANDGVLKPIYLQPSTLLHPPQNTITDAVQIFEPATVQLLNSILTDRTAGVAQFGQKSTLDVPGQVVAVKTGTSRDFHDNWTVGYTPDYVVGVWIGNAANEPMQNLSGATGAGSLWRQIMELLATTEYNKNTPFTYPDTISYEIEDTLFQGLPDDDLEKQRHLLLEDTIILQPHHHDTILFTTDTTIELQSLSSAEWLVDNVPIGTGDRLFWHPPQPGSYHITARTDTGTETVLLEVVTVDEQLP